MVAPQYAQMINEAKASNPNLIEDRPVKRRKKNSMFVEKGLGDVELLEPVAPSSTVAEEDMDNVDGLFEEPKEEPVEGLEVFRPPNLLPSHSQTIDISEDDSDADADFEDVDFEPAIPSRGPGANDEDVEPEHFELNLTATAADSVPSRAPRKKGRVFSKQERLVHLNTHKLHMVCLLASLRVRNRWCNDGQVQKRLLRLLNEKNRQWFKIDPSWTQFRRAESTKKGLNIAGPIWLANFKITARGMRRAYYDDDEGGEFRVSPDMDDVLDLEDFRKAAIKMEGSRIVGAMLYCALLRACGLDVRLVCSMQLLPINAGSKSRPLLRGVSVSGPTTPVRTPTPLVNQPPPDNSTGRSIPSIASRRRIDPMEALEPQAPRPVPKLPKMKHIIESPFPVFWLEVLEEAHQRWMPVDPLVSCTVDKRLKFEPPASDVENAMVYVMGLDTDGFVKDVTRRYTTWYLAKTRKNRVESTPGGERWLRRVLRPFTSRWPTDTDDIEDQELLGFEQREKMPTSIQDFKGHPRYVLERDLRSNEVLEFPRHEIGKVKAGKGGKMEPVYRRTDVKIVRSADGWYRHEGREVKEGEQPVKIRPARRTKVEDDDQEGEDARVALYTEDQTGVYAAPPVVNGRVPKNIYGNLDLYVPSMVPAGGVHIPHQKAGIAARILGIDFADAVTGFEFRGRHGTAVVKGVVVAGEFDEAVMAVIDAYADEERQLVEDKRKLLVLRMWKKFMVGLRIKERVDAYEVDGEDKPDAVLKEAVEDEHETGMTSEEYDMDEGGGFMPGDDGGGFLPEDDDGGGGFLQD